MISESYISATTSGGTAYGAVTPDNYLISPQVQLGGSISFYAGARNTDYCAEQFSVMVSTTDNTSTNSFTTVETWILSLSEVGYSSTPYTVDLSAYAGQTGYVAIRHWGCNDQWVLCIDDITIVEGGGEAPVNPTNPTTDLLAANVYVRLKGGLSQGQYNETMSVATGDVTSNVSLNGEVYPMLVAGSNWWTPTTTMTLEQLEEALGSNAVLINSQDGGFLRYENGGWSGTLTAIASGQMYKVKATAAVSLEIEGAYVASTEVTILPGYNWFGYTGTTTTAIATALGDFQPTNGDTIVDEDNNTATYTNGAWSSTTLTDLVPGKGYVYLSNDSGSKTISF